MSKESITYTARPDTNPEAELTALCAVYAYLLNKKVVEPTPEPDGSDDHERFVNEQRRSA